MKRTDFKDAKGRYLVRISDLDGKSKVCLFRYKDMVEQDKSLVRAFWAVIQKSGDAAVDAVGNPLGDIDDYLEFRETIPDLCG